ncbi:hypothetical protein SHKM778_62850 [Streptomyces sp. KM77-8]|uniref:Secreted protein n=1 Tax=Streptomyces haneummycinicus TaxID=3074435 RepID=A0AAT9HRL3_9ACTN
MVARSVWASLASATARKETRIAQNTATRIPATSPPDTVCTRSLETRLNIEKSRVPEPIAPVTGLRTGFAVRSGWSRGEERRTCRLARPEGRGDGGFGIPLACWV